MRDDLYEFSVAARLDLLQIWNYLGENASLNVADKVLADLQTAIIEVAQIPEKGHRRPDLTDRDIRFYLVHSYLIVYRPAKKPLRILRIVHGARDVKPLLKE